jgi:P4 family phage/plasmid primase-like protien
MTTWESAEGRLQPAAVWYASQGWKILPCYGIIGGRCTCNGNHAEPKDVGKHPSIPEWNTRATSDLETINNWYTQAPENNIGVHCQGSGFFVIDIDPRSDGPASFDKFESLLDGALPPTVEAITGEYSYNGKPSRGRHLFYKCDDNEALVGNLKKSGLPGIDIKHNGYVLIAPSRHFSGNCYEWVPGKAPWEIEMAEAPEELLAVLRKRQRRSGTSLGEAEWGWLDDLDFGGERVEVDKLLEEGIDEGSRAVDIYKLTCALANKFPVHTEAGRLAVETMMIRFNAEKVRPPLDLEGPGGLLMHVRRAIQYVIDNPKTDRMWPGLTEWAQKSQEESRSVAAGNPPTPKPKQTVDQQITAYENSHLPGTIGGTVQQSLNDGDSFADAANLSNIDVPKDPDALGDGEGGEPGKRTLTDTGNGRRLVDSFGPAVRYTPGLGWFHWDGTYWKPDVEDLEMRELAKKLAPVIASEVVNYDDAEKQSEVIKWAQQAKSNSRLAGAIESATSDPRVIVGVDTWDSDAHLLGVANGVIDLRTGELLKGRPDLYITRRAPVAYTQGMRNIRWEQFVDFATGGDKELQEWIQRAAGYSLTGLRTHDVMFLVYGPAGSGKNTFVEAIVKCMGTQQYAWPLDSSILAQGDGQAHGSDLYHWAELRGRRMVWVDELPESERMKENAVKKLTGSSEISARSPGEKPFTFQSQAKLWVTTNHRPIINDDAMWRRLRPIPWLKVPESSDPDLKEYIFDPEGALPAVLSWAVEGAIKLLGSSARDSLGWCTAVSESADIYRKNEDRIGIFLGEETKESEGARLPVKSLYAVYRLWSEERGERPMTQIAFQRKINDRGNEIVGLGSRAEIMGRLLVPRSVPTGEVDWNMATRFGNRA